MKNVVETVMSGSLFSIHSYPTDILQVLLLWIILFNLSCLVQETSGQDV